MELPAYPLVAWPNKTIVSNGVEMIPYHPAGDPTATWYERSDHALIVQKWSFGTKWMVVQLGNNLPGMIISQHDDEASALAAALLWEAA